MQENRIIAAFCILSVSFTLRHFRHDFRDCLAAVQIILFQRVRVNPQGYIRTCMTCSLSCVRNADSCLKLKANRCMTEHMGMDFLQPVLLGKAVQKRSHSIRIDTAAVPFFGVEYGVFLVIPLAAVSFRLFEIVSAIFSEHFHNAVIKRQPRSPAFVLQPSIICEPDLLQTKCRQM